MVYEAWETTWETIKRKDREREEAALRQRIKDREFYRERAVQQQQQEVLFASACQSRPCFDARLRLPVEPSAVIH